MRLPNLCLFEYNDGVATCMSCGWSISGVMPPIYRQCDSVAVKSGLPGQELHDLLRDWLGIEPAPECPCRSMAAKMDRLGPGWVESDDGMSEVLGVMQAEHAKRRNDGLTVLPWSDFAARQLVLLACRRARAKAANG